ncbi:uncharacterized protein LOC108044886 [Drosophila rhopaloa]|uniref:Uncharacterized protein LOC108044886 n=1 Tax=Drosophila rhopaloa TaxID=1041015 RepID=A0A6P4F2G6_DRORH|nr:uncharacterized protein LOC108044886 [Drosophila rhopaloa]
MEKLAVGLAAFFQLMGCFFFFAQPKDRCSPSPDLASWLFLGATMCFLWDVSIYPRRFMHMPHFWQLLVEIVAAVFLAEVGTIIIWCALERFLFYLTDVLLNAIDPSCDSSPYEYWLSGIVTSLVSGAVLWYVLEATDAIYYFKMFVQNLRRTMRVSWRMLGCYINMNLRDRQRALKVCQLARKPPTRKRTARRCCPAEGEDEEEGCN